MSIKEYDETNHDEIAALLIGRRIVEVREMDREKIPADTRWNEYADGLMVLDDGTRLYLAGNEGCGGCSSGWYDLMGLEFTPNVITSVSFEYNPASDDDEDDRGGYYSIYVWAENRKIRTAHFEGTDGNGYYGTGYRIYVVPAGVEK